MITDRIITAESLNQESLAALMADRTLALRVTNFSEINLCNRLAACYEKHPKKTNYTHEIYVDGKPVQVDYGVTRIGTPYNLTYGKAQDDFLVQKYYDEALSTIIEIRNACSPFLAPIDKLRLLLDELHIYGAQLARFEGKPMLAGIARITRAKARRLEEQPHFDHLPPRYYGLDRQFSANVYLTVPKKGGELELWSHTPLTPTQISSAAPNKDWRSELGKSVWLKPQQGDLIIINTQRAHAVRTFHKGSRISISCFIGYKRGKPLLLWS